MAYMAYFKIQIDVSQNDRLFSIHHKNKRGLVNRTSDKNKTTCVKKPKAEVFCSFCKISQIYNGNWKVQNGWFKWGIRSR